MTDCREVAEFKDMVSMSLDHRVELLREWAMKNMPSMLQLLDDMTQLPEDGWYTAEKDVA